MSDTCKVRDLNRDKLAEMLQYGDVGKIAIRCPWYSYNHVSLVIRERRDNDVIWQAVVDYLDSLPEVSYNRRLKRVMEAA